MHYFRKNKLERSLLPGPPSAGSRPSPTGRGSAPALALRRQSDGPQQPLDMKPAQRLVAVDALELSAHQHRVIEAQPRAEIAQRRRHLGDEQSRAPALRGTPAL